METKLAGLGDRAIEAGWLAAVVAVPLFFDPYSARAFEPDKVVVLRGIVLFMALAWVVSFSGRERSPGAVAARTGLPAGLAGALLLFLATQALAAATSLAPRLSLWGSYERLQGLATTVACVLLFALVAGRLRSRVQLERLIDAAILASAPVGVYAVLQRWDLDPLSWTEDVRQRVASTLGTANFVAAYLALVAPVTAARLVGRFAAPPPGAESVSEQQPRAARGSAVLYAACLALQVWTVVLSQSRGPLLALLAAGAALGLVVLTGLRRRHSDRSALSLLDFGRGAAGAVPIGLAGALGACLGLAAGSGLERATAMAGLGSAGLPLTGALLGVWSGLGVGTARAARVESAHRWLWVSWLGVYGAGILGLVVLNARGTPLDPVLAPLRDAPYVERLARLGEARAGTGRVRVLMWEAALELARPHPPIGIPGDEVAPPDRFSALRPLVGHGQELTRQAVESVYPPELFHLERRPRVMDRAHNETLDLLVATGALGAAAWWLVVAAVVAAGLRTLGWIRDARGQWRLMLLLGVGGASGAMAARVAAGTWTFAALGFAAGFLIGALAFLAHRARSRQDAPRAGDDRDDGGREILAAGLLAALVAHLICLQFAFSVAATAVLCWTFAGALVALGRATAGADPSPAAGEPRRPGARTGFASSVALGALVFAFVAPAAWHPDGGIRLASVAGVLLAAWLAGLGLALAAAPPARGRGQVLRTAGRFGATSIAPAAVYLALHLLLVQRFERLEAEESWPRAAAALAALPAVFQGWLILGLCAAAWTAGRACSRPPRVHSRTASAGLVVVGVALAAVGWKNLAEVRADVLHREGERRAVRANWEPALALFARACAIDPSEAAHRTALASAHQRRALDASTGVVEREDDWQRGLEVLRAARRLNPYEADRTADLGRFEFARAESGESERFRLALEYFERACLLAPTNAELVNMRARAHGGLGETERSLELLDESLAIDERYPETWILLGDVHVVRGEADEALAAHVHGIGLGMPGSDGLELFADEQLERRLAFYRRTGRFADVLAALEALESARAGDPLLESALARARAESAGG